MNNAPKVVISVRKSTIINYKFKKGKTETKRYLKRRLI